MVKFIPLTLALGLRSSVLRNGLPLEQCMFPTDELEGVFHLAYEVDGKIGTVATFFPQNLPTHHNMGYQLRGMATDPAFNRKGFGTAVLHFAIEYIKKTNAGYIWCNARSSAVKFYEKLGFELISDEFQIDGIGPHYKMILNF